MMVTVPRKVFYSFYTFELKKGKKITLFPSKELSYKLNGFCFEKNLQYLSHFSYAAAA